MNKLSRVIWNDRKQHYEGLNGEPVHMKYKPGTGFIFEPKQPEKPASSPLARAVIAFLNMEPSTKGLPGDAISGPESGEKVSLKTQSPAVSREQAQRKPTEPVRGILGSLLDKFSQRRLQVPAEEPNKKIQESSKTTSDYSSVGLEELRKLYAKADVADQSSKTAIAAEIKRRR